MAYQDDLSDHKGIFDDDWTSPDAYRAVGLVGLLIAVFFLLSLVFPPHNQQINQTQLDQSQPALSVK